MAYLWLAVFNSWAASRNLMHSIGASEHRNSLESPQPQEPGSLVAAARNIPPHSRVHLNDAPHSSLLAWLKNIMRMKWLALDPVSSASYLDLYYIGKIERVFLPQSLQPMCNPTYIPSATAMNVREQPIRRRPPNSTHTYGRLQKRQRRSEPELDEDAHNETKSESEIAWIEDRSLFSDELSADSGDKFGIGLVKGREGSMSTIVPPSSPSVAISGLKEGKEGEEVGKVEREKKENMPVKVGVGRTEMSALATRGNGNVIGSKVPKRGTIEVYFKRLGGGAKKVERIGTGSGSGSSEDGETSPNTATPATSCIGTTPLEPTKPAIPSPISPAPLPHHPVLRRKKRPKPAADSLNANTKLMQLHLDLGPPLRQTCKECLMSYIPCSPEDSSLHRRFHAKRVGGIDFRVGPTSRVVWSCVVKDSKTKEVVVTVDRGSEAGERRKVKEVMEVVDGELGCGEIGEGELWSGVGDGVGGGAGGAGGRFKVYLYVIGRKCVGLCLTERIKRAYTVTFCPFPSTSSPSLSSTTSPPNGPHNIKDPNPNSRTTLTLSPTPHPAILGISHIWTCSVYRRRGIAMRLIEVARENFIYGMAVERERVAFSQTTEMGSELAEGWWSKGKGGGDAGNCGKEGGVAIRGGWAVYIDKER
ncbi:hypothetical protein BDZ91DRAFT_780808 [Kalaharituber pfeilii]|nr:hypothetical protein BDZ91DRAFT_780808 [Kalaharituber pfeilii]